MSRIGFVVNPIAGMGGRVGLKGTDGVLDEAIARGATPTAQARAGEMLAELRRLAVAARPPPALDWLTASGAMGADCLAAAGIGPVTVAHEVREPSGAADTRAAVRRFLEEGVDLVVFCGGDGTARDVAEVAARRVPVIGVAAGVKMFSGVFGVSPRRTAELILGFLDGRFGTSEVDILDLDETRYRRGEWSVRLCDSALTPYDPALTQSAKMLLSGADETAARGEIASTVIEEMEAATDTLFLLGPGSTVKAVGELLGIDKTLLGIDAVIGGRLAGRDLNEAGLLALLARHPRARLVLSPIGRQGFVLGRGNLQLSPRVIRRIGPANVTVVATPGKLALTPVLRFDTGDEALDAALARGGHLPVVTGHRRRRMVRTAL